MSQHRLVVSAFAILASTACNPFNRQAVEVSANDANLNKSWHANLASPGNLAGAVQMNGSASMAPGTDGIGTTITINLANASPGGLHPWEARTGQCGMETHSGALGDARVFQRLEVENNGRADGSATLSMLTPSSGRYFAVVYASEANSNTVVACGNLAAPTG